MLFISYRIFFTEKIDYFLLWFFLRIYATMTQLTKLSEIFTFIKNPRNDVLFPNV